MVLLEGAKPWLDKSVAPTLSFGCRSNVLLMGTECVGL
jgi:hypothetical protein